MCVNFMKYSCKFNLKKLMLAYLYIVHSREHIYNYCKIQIGPYIIYKGAETIFDRRQRNM